MALLLPLQPGAHDQEHKVYITAFSQIKLFLGNFFIIVTILNPMESLLWVLISHPRLVISSWKGLVSRENQLKKPSL